VKRNHLASSVLARALSSTSPPTPSTTMPSNNSPLSVNKEMAFDIQTATKMYVKYGIGNQRLSELSKESGDSKTLVSRWQRMMEAFLGTQVHVLAGLGYTPNENGLQMYNQHVAMFMQTADPETQEELRLGTRNLWRYVLSTTFNISMEDIESNEMTIVDARNCMHKVAQKMQDPDILEKISLKASKLETSGDATMDMAMKHQIVQDTLVGDVYLGGSPSLVEECGFEGGEKGYVFMQCVMAEHQNDPLIAQYVGSAMMQLMKAAGIDMQGVMQQASEGAKQN